MSAGEKRDAPLHPATVFIHGGRRATPASPAVVMPITNSTTFLLDDAAYERMSSGRADEALFYTRIANPSLDVVQARIAQLEAAERALVFASGMAAIHAAVMSVVSKCASIVAPREIYGSAWDLFTNLLSRFGIETRFVDMTDLDVLAREIAATKPAVVYAESISNPTLTVVDVQAIAALARRAGAACIVDATFATPILQRPLALGADLVVHSATKYMGGHSDLIGGVAAGSAERMKLVHRWLQLAGGCMDPHAAFLLDRGLKTLPIRMRAHVENAETIARHLSRHPRVKRVFHPALETHRSHSVAKRALDGFGGMLSFVVEGGDAAALRFARALELAIEASSLGGVETLVSLPYNTSHARMSAADRAQAGIEPGFVRVSIGIEDHRDLIADFDRALARS